MACAVVSSFAKTGSLAASPIVETRFPWFVCHASDRGMASVAKCILLRWEPPNLLGNLQYIDCRMFASLHLVTGNMRASQLIF